MVSKRVGPVLMACVAASILLGGGPAAAAATPDAPSSTPAPFSPVAPSGLGVGDELTVGQMIASPNGQHLLTVQSDGNVVLYVKSSGRPRWASSTTGDPARRLVMQPDGNLVLYGAADEDVLWASNTSGRRDARLAVLDDGSLVLAWAGGRRELAGPDDRLAAGEQLVAGQTLTSPGGRFSLVMQDDGNLVEIESGRGPVWASGTSGDNVTSLDATGDLVVRRTGLGAVQWTSRTADPGGRLVVQDDGNLVIYAGGTAIWSRGAEEKRRVAAAAALPSTTATLSPGDDYPDKNAAPCGRGVYCQLGSVYSARGFAYRNCTDFVAWKIGLTWSQIADGRNGHAVGWKQGWIERGRAVGTTPRVGAVAWWSRGSYGHVAYVVAVNPDGSAVVEQYNAGGTGTFSTETVRAEAYLY